MQKKNKDIYVTMPTLAPLSEYVEILKGIWDRGILTHNGPIVQDFEKGISEKLSLKYFSAVTNGTVAIQIAIKALQLKGEIITTPFTWIATISAIQWEGCYPVFCDINEKTLNIDVTKIENLITENTVAILAVHVFGNPCDIKEIERIANKHNLRVIYDGAHAIGSTYENKSILEYGDISTTSLHATKLLNTAEGGGCITNSLELHKKIQRIRFFGHNDDKTDIEEIGFNGKMTEVHAALGIANLKYYDSVLIDRRNKYFLYKSLLYGINNISFQIIEHGESNYSYFPIIFENENILIKILETLNSYNIYPRRYFYPSVNTFTNVLNYQPMSISEDFSKRILCLPLYYDLSNEEIQFICNQIKTRMLSL
ncbi:MAG: DegT/DnrJ/EryC1/StrS family aminotransferase [Bacteroidia bacterium]|nr:DegT/DnrJ/EryC1/StrS family aminotransferase [Bacteroidia bacterium]